MLLRWLKRIVIGVVGLVGAGVATLAVIFHLSLPNYTDNAALEGLSERVEIERDGRGFVTIRAQDERDAYFALGYVHAQDRLWQMEMTRRIGTGRLSEVIGSLGTRFDRYIRTLGVPGRAAAQLEHLGPDTLQAVAAYTDGVNAWLTERDRPLPPEFQIAFHSPEPWRQADSLVWGQLMGLTLSFNMGSERRRERWSRTLGPDLVEDLLPAPAPSDPITLPANAQALLDAYAPPPRLLQPVSASNAWVLDGTRTASGAPILANDPHLNFDAPSLWYFARIELPDRSLTGVTVPGVPFHILGHNDAVAWGMTTTYADTQDLFVETLLEDGARYQTPDGPKPLASREEVITVRFGEDERLTVRETRNGPLISDVWPEAAAWTDVAVALAFAAHRGPDTSPNGIYRMNKARNAAEFREALRLFSAPIQNVHYADINGDIGIVAAGRIPIRKAGNGLAPVDGASGAFDWIGEVPFEDLPQWLNPPGGVIRNANNKIVPDTFPRLISAEAEAAHRARRLDELIAADAADGGNDVGHRLEDSIAWQMDVVSDSARLVLPVLLRTEAASDDAETALTLLQGWNGEMRRDGPEPLIYSVWSQTLAHRLAASQLGEDVPRYWRDRDGFILRALEEAVWRTESEGAAPTPADQLLSETLEAALASLREAYGADVAAWRWGEAHIAQFEHNFLGQIPLLNWLANRSIPSPGGDHTLNRGQAAASEDGTFPHIHGPGYRAVYDLADLSNSRFSVAGGQSGHFLSPHYDDLLEDWVEGRYFRVGSDATARRVMILTPK